MLFVLVMLVLAGFLAYVAVGLAYCCVRWFALELWHIFVVGDR
jgi:hypothetical protein